MAIDIQAPNMSGLTAIAGGSAPLNIQPTGALGLQALQQRQANDAALRANYQARMQLQQEGQLALGGQQIQQQLMNQNAQQAQRQGLLDQGNLAMRQQEFGAAGAQNAAENEYKQQQLAQAGALGQAAVDNDKQRLFQEQQQKEMANLVLEKKEKLQEKGAFASFAVMAMKGAKSPEEAQQMRTEILKEAVDKGMYTKEQAQQAASLPLSQFNSLVQSEIIKYGVASEHKALMDANKEKSATSGTNMTFDPETGQLTSMSIDPTSAMKTKAQGEVNDRSQNLIKLRQFRNDLDPKLFTRLNNSKLWASKQAELNKGIPVLGAASEAVASYATGKNAEDRGADLKKATGYLNALEQFFNQTYKQPMTGAAVGEQELKDLRAGYVSGDMSVSQAIGALEQLIRKNVGEKEFNQNFLAKGSDVSPDEDAGLRQHLKSKGYSEQEINDYLKSKGN